MSTILYRNTNKADVLKKYLYTNNLTEDEIDRRIEEFGNDYFLIGVDAGSVVKRNILKRVEKRKVSVRDKAFEKVFEELDEQHEEFRKLKKK